LQWSDKKAYQDTRLKLASLFKKNFDGFTTYKIGGDQKLTEEIVSAGPIFWWEHFLFSEKKNEVQKHSVDYFYLKVFTVFSLLDYKTIPLLLTLPRQYTNLLFCERLIIEIFGLVRLQSLIVFLRTFIPSSIREGYLLVFSCHCFRLRMAIPHNGTFTHF